MKSTNVIVKTSNSPMAYFEIAL